MGGVKGRCDEGGYKGGDKVGLPVTQPAATLQLIFPKLSSLYWLFCLPTHVSPLCPDLSGNPYLPCFCHKPTEALLSGKAVSSRPKRVACGVLHPVLS